MAVIGRKKKAVATRWNAINKKRNDADKKNKEETDKKEQITKEEHEERIKMLKELEVIRDN